MRVAISGGLATPLHVTCNAWLKETVNRKISVKYKYTEIPHLDSKFRLDCTHESICSSRLYIHFCFKSA